MLNTKGTSYTDPGMERCLLESQNPIKFEGLGLRLFLDTLEVRVNTADTL